ncbi:MAG TPA: methyltransferase type 12 [Gammaproteobacteria bacterium]
MTNNKPNKFHLNGRWAFMQQFLKHPFQIGSIIPSSRFLERRIVAAAEIASANVVVELGPGTGNTTRAILRAMPPHAKLLSIEINPHFHSMVSRINDGRLIAHLGSACDLKDILSSYGLDAPSAIISGIPFSTMSRSMGSQILESVSSSLSANGQFVAYQVSNRVAMLTQPIMGSGQIATELLNIPPMRIYRWDKTNA